MSSIFSTKPTSKKKGVNNASGEPTVSKSVPPSRKEDKIHSPDSNSTDDDPKQFQGVFFN